VDIKRIGLHTAPELSAKKVQEREPHPRKKTLKRTKRYQRTKEIGGKEFIYSMEGARSNL